MARQPRFHGHHPILAPRSKEVRQISRIGKQSSHPDEQLLESGSMHEDHPTFERPPNPDVSIWRYMDLAKFVSMLESQALHFARVDTMEDAFEGSIGKATLRDRRENWFGDMPDASFEPFNAQWSDANKRMLRDYTYLNCWHMGKHESVAMWKLYQSGEPAGHRDSLHVPQAG